MKICWISDFDIKGSGYKNISIPLCNLLGDMGHEVKAPALHYSGQEHYYNFSMLPAKDLRESAAIAQNLFNLWGFDILMVALDIPIQEMYLKMINEKPFKYAGLMAVEADPLCQTWAMNLMQMDQRFYISEFGRKEAEKLGVGGIHIPIGIDTESWKMATTDEKLELRKSLGIPEDAFVVLTVADNQERKHLSAGIEIFSRFYHEVPDSNPYYIIVTREHSPAGWKLRDLAQEFDISDRFMVHERGMNHKQLWSLYALSDLFLLPSKAEGLGMPLLEAMSVGIPCMATDCTGMRELLSDGRGILVPYVHKIIDPFGNGNRYMIDIELATHALKDVYWSFNDAGDSIMVDGFSYSARKYVEQRTWDIAAKILEQGLLEIIE